MAIHQAAQQGFSNESSTYQRGRPEYPPELLGWLDHDLGVRAGAEIVDLGAGTGKFTKLLARLGAGVTAIEPVDAMREQLVQAVPGVRALPGSAESIPLGDASVDALACAQAFHWFANEAALREIHRVLRPGGQLGLIWNVRDESVDWVAAITGIITPYEGDAPRHYTGRWRQPFAAQNLFTPLQRTVFAHSHVGTLRPGGDRPLHVRELHCRVAGGDQARGRSAHSRSAGRLPGAATGDHRVSLPDRGLAEPTCGLASFVAMMPNAHSIDLSGLVEHLRHTQSAARRLIAIAGPPGAGKSTVVQTLCAKLNQHDANVARILAMDGFHFDDRVLEARGQLARKGAPDTFDVDGFAAVLDRLRTDHGHDIAVPVFDRALEIARAGAEIVPASTRIVIVEGNYLLLDDPTYPSWASLASRFDVTVMLDVPRARLAERLAARWRGFGLDGAAVAAKVEGNDLVNADLVIAHSRAADFRLHNDDVP